MKRDYSRVLTFGIIVSFLFLLLTFKSRSGEAEKAATMVEVYKKLYFGQIAADVGISTAVLTRMAQGDYNTATNVLALHLKGELMIMNSNTNYEWSDQEKKVKAMAEEYLKRFDKK